MTKFLFFDCRDLESLEGFTRRLEAPRKSPANPLLVSDLPCEVNLMSLYGSVIRRPDGLWQLWYKCYNPNGRGPALGYAESDDGIAWRRPPLDVVSFDGRPTNIVFDLAPHGTAVLYDEREERPAWRYKMAHGAKPTERLSAHRSPDGIHWSPVADNPILGIGSGGPVGLHRGRDGRYVLHIRPHPFDRRAARSESWDFLNWSEPRIVMDQDPADPPQVQFYGMGAVAYGGYELGTLWIYRTASSDMGFYKKQGNMVPELAYSRTGYAWHRAASGQDWIALGEPGSWEAGQIHPASAPVLLADEVRYYYAASRVPHEVTTRGAAEPLWGIGYAALKPDRFVALCAASAPAALLTRPFWSETPQFRLNAQVAGEVRCEVADLDGRAIEGFAFDDCAPVTGDRLDHRLRWRGEPAQLANREIRLRLRARDAQVYAIASGSEEELGRYWEFRLPGALDMAAEVARM